MTNFYCSFKLSFVNRLKIGPSGRSHEAWKGLCVVGSGQNHADDRGTDGLEPERVSLLFPYGHHLH